MTRCCPATSAPSRTASPTATRARTVVPQGTWDGFERPDWLDPRTDGLRRGRRRLLPAPAGTVRRRPTTSRWTCCTRAATPVTCRCRTRPRAVETALQKARPGATWVILGWQTNPRRDAARRASTRTGCSSSTASPTWTTVTDREKDWGGTPYAFGTHPELRRPHDRSAPTTRLWTEQFTAWRDKPGSALAGIAYMPEAADSDPAALELFTELAWREEPSTATPGSPRTPISATAARTAGARRPSRALRDDRVPRSAARTAARTTRSSPPGPSLTAAPAPTTPRTPRPSTRPASTRPSPRCWASAARCAARTRTATT